MPQKERSCSLWTAGTFKQGQSGCAHCLTEELSAWALPGATAFAGQPEDHFVLNTSFWVIWHGCMRFLSLGLESRAIHSVM